MTPWTEKPISGDSERFSQSVLYFFALAAHESTLPVSLLERGFLFQIPNPSNPLPQNHQQKRSRKKSEPTKIHLSSLFCFSRLPFRTKGGPSTAVCPIRGEALVINHAMELEAIEGLADLRSTSRVSDRSGGPEMDRFPHESAGMNLLPLGGNRNGQIYVVFFFGFMSHFCWVPPRKLMANSKGHGDSLGALCKGPEI